MLPAGCDCAWITMLRLLPMHLGSSGRHWALLLSACLEACKDMATARCCARTRNSTTGANGCCSDQLKFCLLLVLGVWRFVAHSIALSPAFKVAAGGCAVGSQGRRCKVKQNPPDMTPTRGAPRSNSKGYKTAAGPERKLQLIRFTGASHNNQHQGIAIHAAHTQLKYGRYAAACCS